MSKYDANAVQMCGKHGKCRIYSHIYKPYVIAVKKTIKISEL